MHPYKNNIFKELKGPCPPIKDLNDFTMEEIEAFPKLVPVPKNKRSYEELVEEFTIDSK